MFVSTIGCMVQDERMRNTNHGGREVSCERVFQRVESHFRAGLKFAETVTFDDQIWTFYVQIRDTTLQQSHSEY